VEKSMRYGLSEATYNKIKDIIKKYNNYEFKIFGSRARGNYKQNSDIDIVVLGSIKNKEQFNIKNDFDLLDIPYTIDLIFMQDITKKELIDSIKKEAKTYGE